ncbi:CATRA system-associated protein [Micromonospora tulbaghiae]|uniref:CATRA system-associated protein n=1 Tax=Micromonospora tulbaghiae TaxID=479978 RepID=UPI0036A6AEAE
MDHAESWDAETISDALDLLQDMVLWDLVPERWEHIGLLLSRLEVALATGEADEARDVVVQLELSGPVRANRIGSAEKSGIPEPILERRNTLVHSLTGERDLQSRDQQDTSRTGVGRGDRPDR